MSELTLLWIVPIRLFAVVVYSTLYVISGRGYTGKWVRRFLAPACFIAFCCLITHLVHANYFKLAPLLALPIVLSLGYSNNDGKGWIRRLIYGLLFAIIGLSMAFLYGCWPVGMLQAIFAVSTSMVMGLLNPIEAVNEESVISAMSVILIPFMIR